MLLLRAQRAVLDYGLTLDVVRIRFQQFRSDADAVAKVCGATLLRTAFKATEPGPAMLRFLEGEYITTEPGRVRVLSGGKMQYKQQSTWRTAAGKYKWSSKHKSLFIVGGGGGWRLDVTKSTDNTIVWINVKDVTEDGVQSQIVYNRQAVPRPCKRQCFGEDSDEYVYDNMHVSYKLAY